MAGVQAAQAVGPFDKLRACTELADVVSGSEVSPAHGVRHLERNSVGLRSDGEPFDRLKGAARGSRLQTDEAFPERVFQKLGLAVQVELPHDALSIGLDCVGADVKKVCYLMVRTTVG